MAWYNPKTWGQTPEISFSDEYIKLNPGQEDIMRIEGGPEVASTEFTNNYTTYYETIEVVKRGTDMVVNDAAEVPFLVEGVITNMTPLIPTEWQRRLRADRLERLLNYEPNPFQDISSFKRNMLVDLILDGNIFIYFDGAGLYNLPADQITVVGDEETYIKEYRLSSGIIYKPEEIIHIKDNSFKSIYRGTSRLKPARNSMKLVTDMKGFQNNFFKNGTVTGLIIKSENMLSEKVKERMIQNWLTRYNPLGGGRTPLILDGGLQLDRLSNVSFKDLDFQTSIEDNEKVILKSIGVPPVLIDSGNNANIRPNHRLYYLETVIPIIDMITAAFQRYFGWKIVPDLTEIQALQPELNEQASYYSSLVNGGIMTASEAREKLGLARLEGHDDIRIPANIAGSAVNPSEGGRPPDDEV